MWERNLAVGLCKECTGAHPTIKMEDLRPNPHKCEKVERDEPVPAAVPASPVPAAVPASPAPAAVPASPETPPTSQGKQQITTSTKGNLVSIPMIEVCILGIIGAVIGVPLLAQHIKWSWDMWVNVFWLSACIATTIVMLVLVVTLIGVMIKKLRDFSS
jgi:hypothetical protein